VKNQNALIIELIRAGNRVVSSSIGAIRPGIAHEPRFKKLRNDILALSIVLGKAQEELLTSVETRE